VTRTEFTGSSPSLSDAQDRRSVSQDGSSSLSNQSPRNGYRPSPQEPTGFYPDPNVYDDDYRSTSQPPGAVPLDHLPHTQRLTSLMEAALASQTFTAFPLIENLSPSPWDGFGFGSDTNTYMGAYDADMSWTLDYLPSENSPNYLLDHDMLNSFDDLGHYQFSQPKFEQPSTQDTDDADGEDEDTADWPDKIDRPNTPPRIPNRVVPIQMQPISWLSVLDEAQLSGLSTGTIRPSEAFSNPLRDTLLVTLNGSNFRNEISRPEISESLFPPAEVLDFFLRLYVKYIHPRFPVLHLPTFNIYTSSPLLLVAMMFLGSSHSNADRGRFSRMFHEHLRIAIIRIQEVDKKYVLISTRALGIFLIYLSFVLLTTF
jgi:hypothetical protein